MSDGPMLRNMRTRARASKDGWKGYLWRRLVDREAEQ